MGRIDAKLGKWFKQVEQVEKELQLKKKTSVTQNESSSVSPVEDMVKAKKPSFVSESVEIITGSDDNIINADYIESNHSENAASEESDSNIAIKVLIDESVGEASEIEDFMSYLDKVSSQDNDNHQNTDTEIDYTGEAKPSNGIDKYMAQRDEQIRLQAAALREKKEEIEKSEGVEETNIEKNINVESDEEISYNNSETTLEDLEDNDLEDSDEMGVGEVTVLDNLSEGTGSPRPISKPTQKNNSTKPIQNASSASRPIAEMPQKKESDKTSSDWTGAPKSIKPEPRAETVKFKEETTVVKQQESVSSENGWDNVPSHLKILFADTQQEVAQNSYKKFRESRGMLIERLLDPPITLEEAARILNVCPTTVRRYTNKGVLRHFRTAGNQRRFKLSDVLAFMESQVKLDKSKSI